MAVFDVDALGQKPDAAAAQFYSRDLPLITARRGGASAVLTIMFPPADYAHTAWRLAAVQGLARDAAPQRINAVSGGSPAARQAALRYLEAADGVTGQLLQLDDAGAQPVIGSDR